MFVLKWFYEFNNHKTALNIEFNCKINLKLLLNERVLFGDLIYKA